MQFLILLIFTFLLFIVAFFIIRKAYLISSDKSSFWNTLSGNILSTIGIFIALIGFLYSFERTREESQKKEVESIRERIIKEKVYWEAKINHIPNQRDLDIIVYCYKTAETIEPKEIQVTIDVKYRNEKGLPSDFTLSRTYNNILLTNGDELLKWELKNIQDEWVTFRDKKDGYVSDISVLENPLLIDIEINYNIDLTTQAQAQLYPEFINKDYKNKGIKVAVKFEDYSQDL